MTLTTANDELSNRIVKIEQDIKELKTSQSIGQATAVLIKVSDIDLTKSFTDYMTPWLMIEFVSSDTISPLIMPKVKIYYNGSLASGYIDYNRYNVLGTYLDYTGFANPYMTGCSINPSVGIVQSGTIRIVGEVFANCYGNIKQEMWG